MRNEGQKREPLLELWELDDAQWRKIFPRPYERHPQPADGETGQLALPLGMVGRV